MAGPGSGTTAAGVVDFTSAAAAVLRTLKARVGLDVWVVARRDGEDFVVLAALGDGGFGIDVGDVLPWSDTSCARMVAGRTPCVAPDVHEVPASAELEAEGNQAGTCISVPITTPDGALLGMLCAAGRTPRSAELKAALPLVELQAGLLGTLLSHELRLEQETRRAEHAELQAFTDPLTGLGNRRGWDAALAAEERRARRYASPVAVIVVDLDALRAVNDAGGHDAGDRLLRRAAAVLRARVRTADLLARLGGGEFGVLLPETDLAGATVLAAQLREELQAAGMACSLGVAARRATDGLAQAWRDADTAMYAEKVVHRARHLGPVAAPGADAEGPGPAPAATPRPTATTPQPLPTAAPGPAPQLDSIEVLLALAREQLGMDVAFLGQFDGDERVIRNAAARIELPVGAGLRQPREETHCQRIVDGRMDSVTHDVSADPQLAALPYTEALGMGAYLGVPIQRSTGELFGTLCCFSQEADPTLRPRDAGVLRVLAGMMMELVEREEHQEGDRRGVLDRLDRMYDAGGPVPVYQPVLALDGLTQVGVEALSRFPDGINPAEWFAAAASVGAGTDLELRALDRAAAALPDVAGFLALNVSSATVGAPGFSRRLAELPLYRLVLELTEHEAIEDYQTLSEVLRPLRARGLRLAVDDAGAGFASMRHILVLMPDFIKLDISLVRDIDHDPARQALASALVAFAASTGAQIIAEGVETAAELACLRRLRVPHGQGYHLARPGPLVAAGAAAAPADVPALTA